jgi:hypothetical protein
MKRFYTGKHRVKYVTPACECGDGDESSAVYHANHCPVYVDAAKRLHLTQPGGSHQVRC